MYNLCIAELAEILDGQVALGVMPPLAGMFEPIGRIVADSREVRARDVFWAFSTSVFDGACYVDEAFSRGALGVVTCRRIEPWAGKFAISVADPAAALHRLMRCLHLEAGASLAHLFGDDVSTVRMVKAVRTGDTSLLEDVASQLGRRAATVA